MSSFADLLEVARSLPPTLTFLTNPISSYFNSNPPYNNVELGALIVTPPPEPPRILLLQGAQGVDPHAFSGFWQVPSGKPTLADTSMLHALARIVYEQTGLHIRRVAIMLGAEEGSRDWLAGNVPWLRMFFMVEVAELAPPGLQTPENRASDVDQPFEAGHSSSLQRSVPDAVDVRVNPDKHRSHVWVNEEDLMEFINARLYPMEETTQYGVMLEAFAYYRQDFARLEYLRRVRYNIVLNQRTGS